MIPEKKMQAILDKFETKADLIYNQSEVDIRLVANDVRIAGGDISDVEVFRDRAHEILERKFTKWREKDKPLSEE